MTTNLYLRLNNLFPSDMDIVAVKKFKRTSIYPAAADTPEKRLAFQKKYKDFDIKGENVFYTPKNLQVVPKIYKKQTLKKEYKKIFGSGSRNFYKTIREKYLKIKRSDVLEFMKTQKIPQLTDNFKHRTNKPIVSQYPNQIWCIDLIFSGIDVFSRKIFLEPTRMKDAATISKCLDKIIRREGVKPKYIIWDNGKEFLGEFDVYCEAHQITIRRNRAYSPQANGIVERSNMEIRKLLRDIMLENEDTNWIDQLRRVENLKKDTYTSGIENIPSKIWNNKNEPIRFEVGQSTDEQMRQLLAKQTILKNVKKQIKEFKDDELDVGDKVRVRMDQISNNIRSLVKDGKTKQVVIVWSPVIFKILKKIVPRKGMLERSRYVVGSVDGSRMLVNTEKGTKPRNFYANALKKVEKDEKDYSDLSMVEAIRLSGVDLNRNDVYSAPYHE